MLASIPITGSGIDKVDAYRMDPAKDAPTPLVAPSYRAFYNRAFALHRADTKYLYRSSPVHHMSIAAKVSAIALTLILAIALLPLQISALSHARNPVRLSRKKDTSVLILGGGVTGVIAARMLHERGYDNFLIIEARDELGGRMQNRAFGSPGKQFTVEQGPNWVQGTQTGNGPANPIYELVRKHDVKTKANDLLGSVCT